MAGLPISTGNRRYCRPLECFHWLQIGGDKWEKKQLKGLPELDVDYDSAIESDYGCDDEFWQTWLRTFIIFLMFLFFRKWDFVKIFLRKGNFWQCQKVKFILLPRASPPGAPNPDPSSMWGLPALGAIYVQNISTNVKSYWQPWMVGNNSKPCQLPSWILEGVTNSLHRSNPSAANKSRETTHPLIRNGDPVEPHKGQLSQWSRQK